MDALEKAKAEYDSATSEQKAILLKIFGNQILPAPKDWMECWKRFLALSGKDLSLPYPANGGPDEEYINAQFMMMHIVRHFRNKKPDFNSDEPKWAPWFNLRNPSGSGFSSAYYDAWDTGTSAGSRLCFPVDEEMAIKIVEEYKPIWEKIMIEP